MVFGTYHKTVRTSRDRPSHWKTFLDRSYKGSIGSGYVRRNRRRRRRSRAMVKFARPRRRGRMGNAVGFIGIRNIARGAKNSISRKKAEQYTLDGDFAVEAPALTGFFSKITTLGLTTIAQDMNLGGLNRHPLPGVALTSANYGKNRIGLAVNQTFFKVHLCVSAQENSTSTCNRIVLLEVIDRNSTSRSAPNSYQWGDFFETATVTSFYNTKKNASDSFRSMTKYKVLLDRSLVLNDITMQNDKLINFNIPKHTITVADTVANETSVKPTLQQGSKRYILFLVSDAPTSTDRPEFTGEYRVKFQDP